MGHHSADANCEWDIVVICRRVSETYATPPTDTVDSWVGTLEPMQVGSADISNFELAIQFLEGRMGAPIVP